MASWNLMLSHNCTPKLEPRVPRFVCLCKLKLLCFALFSNVYIISGFGEVFGSVFTMDVTVLLKGLIEVRGKAKCYFRPCKQKTHPWTEMDFGKRNTNWKERCSNGVSTNQCKTCRKHDGKLYFTETTCLLLND